MKPIIRLTLSFIFFFCSIAKSAVLLTDNFSYPDASLVSDTPWVATTIAGTGNLSINSGAVSYSHSSDNTIRVLNQSALSQSVSSGSLYYTFTFNASDASTTTGGQRIAGLGSGSTTSDSMRGQVWLKKGSVSDTFLIGVSTASGSSSATNWWESDLSINTDYQIVLEYDYASGGSSQLWIDPATENSLSIYATDANNSSTRSTMGLYNRTNVNLGDYTIDNLVVATEFSDLAAVPEPETYSLIASLFVLFYVYKRKKQSFRITKGWRKILPLLLMTGLFANSARALPVVIIKADDLRYVPSTTVDAKWQRFIDYIEEKRIYASVGIITDSLDGAGEDYYEWIRDVQKRGRIEFWHHGYDHLRNADEDWAEFSNTSYEYQKEHFDRGQELAKEHLGFPFRTFGAPYNKVDATTAQVLDEDSDMRVWLYGDTSLTTSKMILDRVSSVNIEIAVGTPDFDSFQSNFPSYLDREFLVIQGHPVSWDDNDWVEFEKIVDYVLEQGSTFMTPFDYYREVNDIPYVIIKADNVEYEISSGVSNSEWQRFLDFLRSRNLKATAGLRGDTMADESGVDKTNYYDWLKDAAEDGTFEYFLYGYDHSMDKENDPATWWEFYNTDYDFQKAHFDLVQDLSQEKLGITLKAFGASWNKTDDTTLQVLEEDSEIKVWLYGDESANTSKLVLPRISDINIEQPVHYPNSAYFEEHYPLYSGQDVLVIQGHPADWDTDELFNEFVAIIDFLEDQGAVFVTPTEYYQIMNPGGAFIYEIEAETKENSRYIWEDSLDLVTWERSGEQFYGNGGTVVREVVFREEQVATFYRCRELPADHPLYENSLDELDSFNDILPGVATSEAGVVLVDETTTPTNLAGTGNAMRFYDYSTTVGVRAFDDISLPSAFKLELSFYNNVYDTEKAWEGPTMRFGNLGGGLYSSTNSAFHINFRKDGNVRAYHADGNNEEGTIFGEAHIVTLYVNASTDETVTYEGPTASRTLNPMCFDLYVNGVMVGSSDNGLGFVNGSGYITTDGIGRFGFNTATTQSGGDYTFDNISISPLK